jgi:hypothetical protein
MEHAAALPAWLAWAAALEHSALGAELRRSLYLYPVVELLHILGFALLIGSIVVVDLRLIGRLQRLPMVDLVRTVVPVSLAGLVMVVPTGLLLFATGASSFIVNPFFQAKLVLIALALVNALWFEFATFRRLARAPGDAAAARAGGFASLALWIGALVCGRLVAYI